MTAGSNPVKSTKTGPTRLALLKERKNPNTLAHADTLYTVSEKRKENPAGGSPKLLNPWRRYETRRAAIALADNEDHSDHIYFLWREVYFWRDLGSFINKMQSVHASWAGTTFALPRCSDSRDKKPRIRRTKEERKTMVESFIKKYQNLNNGKFPSLNLTHKEVGGSFYTVREIVREIIQQNRVLGPGHLTSKALNLEYCPEELGGESLSMDISAPLSISTISHVVDQRQGKRFLLSNEYSRTSLEMIEVDESVNQESQESRPNVSFVSQVPDDEQYNEISNGAYLNGRSENLSYKEPNIGKPSGVANENSGVHEQSNAEVQVLSSENSGKFEHSVPSGEVVSATPSLFESVVNGDGSNDKSTEINSSEASSSLPLSDSLSETDILLDTAPAYASPHGTEDSSLASAGAKPCYPGKFQNIVGATTSLEVPKISDSDEVTQVRAFMPFEKDSVINRSEKAETLSPIVVDEVSAANPSRQLSVEKDSVTDSSERTETLSSIAVDEVSKESHSGVLQNLDSPALANIRSVAHPLSQPNDFENVITNNIIAPGESIQPTLKENAYSEVKHQHEHALSNIGSSQILGSISQNKVRKESETSEINPVWGAIKSLFNAVVKFWTE